MRCQCGHYTDRHEYNEETDAYYQCKDCNCEAFERPDTEAFTDDLDDLRGKENRHE